MEEAPGRLPWTDGVALARHRALVAQRIEQWTSNPPVAGSNPAGRAPLNCKFLPIKITTSGDLTRFMTRV